MKSYVSFLYIDSNRSKIISKWLISFRLNNTTIKTSPTNFISFLFSIKSFLLIHNHDSVDVAEVHLHSHVIIDVIWFHHHISHDLINLLLRKDDEGNVVHLQLGDDLGIFEQLSILDMLWCCKTIYKFHVFRIRLILNISNNKLQSFSD